MRSQRFAGVASPVLGTPLVPSAGATGSYSFRVTTTESAPAADPAFSPVSAIFPQGIEAPVIPWSKATILGWSGLALGTVVTIVLVIVAITLP